MQFTTLSAPRPTKSRKTPMHDIRLLQCTPGSHELGSWAHRFGLVLSIWPRVSLPRQLHSRCKAQPFIVFLG